MFEGWTDDQFNIWLAGFFDGEGCIYIPREKGIEVSIANTNKEVILSIHSRVQCGNVTEVTSDQEKWKTKYQWRVRTYPSALEVLDRIQPFLTIKASKAEQARARIGDWKIRQKHTKQRNQKILDLAKTGIPYQEIADQFGLSYRLIARICQGIISSGHGGHARPEIRELRRHHERSHKTPVKPITKSKIIKETHQSSA